MLWLWPDDSPSAFTDAAASQPPATVGLRSHAAAGKKPFNWYMRDLSYGHDVLLENLVDPAHLPFSHHKLGPALDRSKAEPMPFKPIKSRAGALQEGNGDLRAAKQGAAAAAASSTEGAADSLGAADAESSSTKVSEARSAEKVPEKGIHEENGTFDTTAMSDELPSGRAPLSAFEFPSVQSPEGTIKFYPPSTVIYRYPVGPQASFFASGSHPY